MLMQNEKFSRPVLAIGAVMLLLFSCKSGVDVAELPLDTRHVKNWGQSAKAGELSPGVMAYARLSTSPRAATPTFIDQVKGFEGYLSELRALGPSLKLSSADANDLSFLVDEINTQWSSTLSPLITKATDTDGYFNLAIELKKAIDPAGAFNAKLLSVEGRAKASFQNELKVITQKIRRLLEGFYGTCVVLAQAYVKNKMDAEAAAIGVALDNLILESDSNFKLAVKAEQDEAVRKLTDAKNSLGDLQAYLQKMVTGVEIKATVAQLVNTVNTRINSLQADLVARVADAAQRARAQAFLDKAKAAHKNLLDLANSYPKVADLKNPPEPELQALVAQAFSTPTVANLAIDRLAGPTSLTRLMDKLSESKEMLMFLYEPAGGELMVEALASAVVIDDTGTRKVGVDNVVGLNGDEIAQTVKLFSMNRDEERAFVLSRASKMHEQWSDHGRTNNVYVVFADQFGEIDYPKLIESLKKPGRVVIVSRRPISQVLNGHLGPVDLEGPILLTASEAYVAAHAEAVRANETRVKPIDPSKVSELIAKIMRAYLPNQAGLYNVTKLVSLVYARLSMHPDPTDGEIKNTVISTVVQENPGVNAATLSASRVLVDGLNGVDANVKSDPLFYLK
jgi:hypothetical protein